MPTSGGQKRSFPVPVSKPRPKTAGILTTHGREWQGMPAYFKFHGILTTKNMPKKGANSGKVCPHLVVISGSVQHSYHQVIDLGYAELNWANGGKVCLFFLFCFHCSQQVTFFYSAHRNSVLVQKKNPRILPPKCFLLASSWSMIPPEVVMTM